MLGRLPFISIIRTILNVILNVFQGLWHRRISKRFRHKRLANQQTVVILTLGLFLGLGLVYLFLLRGNNTSANWYHDSWGFRRKLTIDNTKVSGSSDLANFPVLVSFSSDTNLSANAKTDGSDILFTDTKGQQLTHEIEYYSAGTLVAWVKIPSLSATADTVIYMYYGNSSASGLENKTAVWSSDYRGVWHLSETSGQHQDSTSNTNNSTAVTVATQGSATGKIGGADDFASGNEVVIADSDSLDISGSFTAQAWVKADTIGGNGTWNSIIYKGGNSNYFLELTNTDEIDAGFYGGGDWRSVITTNSPVSTGSFYHVAVVHDATADTIKTYVNGVEKGSVSGITQTPLVNTSTFTIGENFYNETFDGIIDEVRLSDAPKSVDWLLTEYNNQNSPTTFYATSHEEVRKRGPAAQWKFDEGYGTVVNDSSGNSVVGTMGTGSSAPTWRTEESCLSGNCIEMDGSDDFLSFGDHLDIEDGQDFTFSAWIKSNSFSTVQTVLAKKLGNSSGQTGYLINIGTGGTLNFYAADGTDQIWKGSSTALATNSWYHIAFVYDEDNASNISFYINGAPSSGNLTGTLSNVNSLANPQILGLGVESDGQYVFNGFIDEAKFYMYARTADEIKQDYLFASSKGSAAVLGADSKSFLSEGLIGYWKMDETTGSTGPSWTTLDSSGNAKNGTGAGNAGPGIGKFGNAGSFDGNGDYVSMGDQTTHDLTFPFTLSSWIQLTQLPSSKGTDSEIMSKYGGSGSRQWTFSIGTDNTLYFWKSHNGTNGEYGVVTGHTFTSADLNVWRHVVYSVDSQGIANLYIDGAQVERYTYSNVTMYTGASTTMRIGARGLNSNYFKGNIDESRIYKRSLSASEVKSLYEWAPGPVAHWSMDASPTYASTITSRINASSDDGEDPVSGGAVDLTSSDLELVVDGSIDQEVGMVFDNIDIPQGTTISNATIQFTVDEADSGTTNLIFYGDDTDNSSTFTTTAGNIRNRTKTSASVNWNSVPAWSTIGEAGSDQRTPNLSSIIQEIVNRSGWSSGNSLAIIVDGTGERTAESYDGSSSAAPLLTITCSPYCNANSVSSLQDISGNNNTGTFYGSISTSSFVTGKYGKALNFNGDTDVVNVTDNEDLNFNGGSFTIATWFNADELPSNTTGADMLLSKANDSGSADARGWEFILDSSTDKVRARLWDNTSDDGSSDGDAYSDNAISTNTWYHAAMVYAADTQELSLYINGVKQQSTATVESSDYAKDLTIGAYNSSGSHSFDGRLDDVKIYKYARTGAQIVQDMNAGHSAVGTPVGSTVLHTKFNEGYGTTVHDSSSLSNNGTLGTGSSAPSWSNDGKFGKALSFDGNDYVDFGDNDELKLTFPFTISAWVNINELPADEYTIISKWYSFTNDREYAFQIVGDNRLRFGFSSTGSNSEFVYADTAFSSADFDQWIHVVLTADVDRNYTFYRNGEVDGSGTFALTSIANDTASAMIGAVHYSNSLPSRFFKGKIDEVKLYPFDLNFDQVQTEYNGGKTMVLGATSTGVGGTTPSYSAGREYCVPGDTASCDAPVAEWKFDENTGTTTNDTSGNGNIGTINSFSESSWSPGKKGSSLRFNGSNTYMTANDSSSLDLSNSFTLSVWVNPLTMPSGGYYETIISKENSVGGNSNYYLELNSDDEFNCGFYSSGYRDHSTTTSPISVNQWQHLSCVFDTIANTVKLYHNGKQVYSASETNNLVANNHAVQIGRIAYGPSQYINAYLDEFKIYNYARTPAQIAWEYNRGAPVAHYKFDECQGTTAYNSALNGDGKAAGNNGTISIGGSGVGTVGNCSTSSTAWGNGSSGKINSSLSFDGTDDYLDMGDPSSGIFDPGTEDFSVSLWMKGGTQTNTLSRLVFKYQAIHVNANHTSICSNKISFEKPSGNSGVCSTTNVNTNTWYHVTAVRQGDIARLYINGILEGTQTGWASENATTNYSLTMGGYPSANHFFNGQIDDVRIYRYALTTDQVKQAHTNGAVSFK